MAIKTKSLYKNDRRIYVFLGVMSLVVFLLSSSVMPFIAGEKAFPAGDLMLCFACLVPAFVPVKSAVVFALVLGFLSDLFLNEPQCFSPIIFLVSVLLVSFFYRFFSRIGSLTMAVCALPCLAIRSIVDTFVIMASYKDSKAFDVLSAITLPSLAVNFALSIVTAFVLRKLIKKLGIFYEN